MQKFKKGQWVWWTDPAKASSGLYYVLDTKEEYNADVTEEEAAAFDDRMILIGNGTSEAEVYAGELKSPRVRVVFRRWWDHPGQPVVALFPDVEMNTEQRTVLSFGPDTKPTAASYQSVLRGSVDATTKEYAPLQAKLRAIGFDQIQIYTHRDYQHEQIMDFAAELAEKQWADSRNLPSDQLYNKEKVLKHEYEDEYAEYYEMFYAQLARLAGYEEEEPAPRLVCDVCGGTAVACDARINPNTGEILGYPDDMDASCEMCGEVELLSLEEIDSTPPYFTLSEESLRGILDNDELNLLTNDVLKQIEVRYNQIISAIKPFDGTVSWADVQQGNYMPEILAEAAAETIKHLETE